MDEPRGPFGAVVLDRRAGSPGGVIPRPREESGSRTSSPGPSLLPSDGDLLERALAFSGTYVSDDGHLAIRRSTSASFAYSESRFVGYCRSCARARLMPPTGEALPDVSAAIRFTSAHDHGELD